MFHNSLFKNGQYLVEIVCGFLKGTPVSSDNKTDHHEITEILLKVALNTINLNQSLYEYWVRHD